MHMDTWSGTTTGPGISSQPHRYAMASRSLVLRLRDGTATIPILTLLGTKIFVKQTVVMILKFSPLYAKLLEYSASMWCVWFKC